MKSGANYGALDAARHLFSVAVVWLHTVSLSRYSAETLAWHRGWDNFVDGCVFGFFLISGFFSVRGNAKEGVFRMGSSPSQMLVRLAVPFFLFSLLNSLLLPMVTDATLAQGLWRTLLLQGMGMQLYFLPYLLLVYLAAYGLWGGLLQRLAPSASAGVLLAAVAGLVYASIAQPTPVSTGPSPFLLYMYAASYLIGQLIRMLQSAAPPYFDAGILAAAAVSVALGLLDRRYYDLAAVLLIVWVAMYCQARFAFLDRRLPGSGGVYLLHTPIVNIVAIIVLMQFGIVEEWNAILATLLTYAACLAAVLLVIRKLPASRRFLLE